MVRFHHALEKKIAAAQVSKQVGNWMVAIHNEANNASGLQLLLGTPIVSNPLCNTGRWAHAAAIRIIAGWFRALRTTTIIVATGIWWWWLEHDWATGCWQGFLSPTCSLEEFYLPWDTLWIYSNLTLGVIQLCVIFKKNNVFIVFSNSSQLTYSGASFCMNHSTNINHW